MVLTDILNLPHLVLTIVPLCGSNPHKTAFICIDWRMWRRNYMSVQDIHPATTS